MTKLGRMWMIVLMTNLNLVMAWKILKMRATRRTIRKSRAAPYAFWLSWLEIEQIFLNRNYTLVVIKQQGR